MLDPGQLLEVIANIDQRHIDWRRKLRLVAIIGRWGDVHEVGQRELAERASLGPNLVIRLLGELIEARVIRVLYAPGGGHRPAAYLVEPDVRRWRVPWLNPLGAVERWTFHEEHAEWEPPPSRAGKGLSRAAGVSSRAGEGLSRAAGRTQPRGRGPEPRGWPEPARGLRASAARLQEDGPQEVPTGGSPGDLTPPPGGSTGGGRSIAAWEVASARKAILAATGGRFLNGPPLATVTELLGDVGLEQLIEWLQQAPAGLGVPRMVEWLADQRHQLDPELVAALEARAAGGGALDGTDPGAEPPAGPRLREFHGHEYSDDGEEIAPISPQERLELVRKARELSGR